MLRIRLEKQRDGSIQFRCTRADDTSVEQMVGLFDRERVGGAPALTAAEFNGILQELVDSGSISSPPVATENQLQTVRTRISELYDSLASLQPGSAMELAFAPAT